MGRWRVGDSRQEVPLMSERALITRGRPLPFLDALKNVMSIPDKLLFLTPDIDSHRIDPAVDEAVAAFAERHELTRVHVRVNEYAPLAELWRLLTNWRVSVLWRFSFGLLTWLAYCVNVGRLLGGDHYNPFSNTVNLYSNHRSIALHEMGHALDFKRRTFPGLYALSRLLPGVALYQEYLASLYAVEYLREIGDHREEIRAYRLLFPAYSTYVFGALIELFPTSVTRSLFFPVVIVGHALGHHFAGERYKELAAAGDPGFTPADLTARDRDAASEMFSSETREGRQQAGTLAGLLAGGVLCGPFAPLMAAAGFMWGSSTADNPA
jgi:hypothetical protein